MNKITVNIKDPKKVEFEVQVIKKGELKSTYKLGRYDDAVIVDEWYTLFMILIPREIVNKEELEKTINWIRKVLEEQLIVV